MAINQQITSAPSAPQRSDPNTFADKADAFVAWLENLDEELNQWASECNSTQDEINQSESSAQAAKQDAEQARDYAYKWATEDEGIIVDDGVNPSGHSAYHYAQQSKRFRDEAAAASDATVYDENTTYNYPDTVIGSDGRVYRCLGNGVLGDDPVTSTSDNWILVIPQVPDGVTTTTISAGQSYQLDNNFLQIISAEDNNCKVILPDATTQTAGKLTYIIICKGFHEIYLYNNNGTSLVSSLSPNKSYLIIPEKTSSNVGYWECIEAGPIPPLYIPGQFAYIFNNAGTALISATTLSNDNVLIAYRDNGNSDYGTFKFIYKGQQ